MLVSLKITTLVLLLCTSSPDKPFHLCGSSAACAEEAERQLHESGGGGKKRRAMAFTPSCLMGDEGPASQQTTGMDCPDDADGHTVLLDEEDSADDGYK